MHSDETTGPPAEKLDNGGCEQRQALEKEDAAAGSSLPEQRVASTDQSAYPSHPFTTSGRRTEDHPAYKRNQ